ncbi:hypothetical protein P3S67_003859 [Capsicum chacoense]
MIHGKTQWVLVGIWSTETGDFLWKKIIYKLVFSLKGSSLTWLALLRVLNGEGLYIVRQMYYPNLLWDLGIFLWETLVWMLIAGEIQS